MYTEGIQLQWLKAKYKRLNLACCLLFKIVSFKIPPSLLPYFKKTIIDCPEEEKVRRSDRNYTLSFLLPKAKTVTYFTSFPIATAKFWNELPDEITSSNNINIFKSKLMNHLIYKQNLILNVNF